MTLKHTARAAGLAIALSLTALTGPAAAQTPIVGPIWPEPEPQPVLQPVVTPCSQIASFSPATARPGQDVDIYIQPSSGRAFFGYTVTGVQFANGVPATFTNVAAHHVRAKVPVGTSASTVRASPRRSRTPTSATRGRRAAAAPS